MTPPLNTLAPAELHVRGSSAGDGIDIDPARAGWRYLSFRTRRLAPGAAEPLDPALEHVVVVIEGGDVEVAPDTGMALQLEGRPSVFDALPTACYVPAGTRCQVSAEGTLVAIASAPPGSPESRMSAAPIAIQRARVKVEIRGAGNATRQVNHIVKPNFPADRLEVVEVLTPSGNWSSWPPHKHDTDNMPEEAVLEEIYYYRFRRPEAWGLQRLYRPDRSRDCAWEVRSGDAVLVTDGYHPFVAAHGDDAYYLNALAGDRRTMACSYDPELDWVRASWAGMAPDPRLPLVR